VKRRIKKREKLDGWSFTEKMDQKPEMDCPIARLLMLFSIFGTPASLQKSTPATILKEMGERYQVNP
jgi:hypothetical protein